MKVFGSLRLSFVVAVAVEDEDVDGVEEDACVVVLARFGCSADGVWLISAVGEIMLFLL